MFFNNLKIAFRNIKKESYYAFINILGLTVGIATSLLIIIFIIDELQYDRFHSKADQIHRVTIHGILSGQEFEAVNSCSPLAATAVEEVPGVMAATRINQSSNIIFKQGANSFNERFVLQADSNFFDVFTFELLEGNPETALLGPNKIVLTVSAAEKYFGYRPGQGESPIGKTLEMANGDRLCEVTAIAADPPGNSHFDFNVIVSMQSYEYSKSPQWTSNNLLTYLVLHPQTDPADVEASLMGLVKKYAGPEIEQYLGMSYEKFLEEGFRYGYGLQPLVDIHLKSHYDGELQSNGNESYLYIFGIIGIFIILIACINFMNLTTARAANRAKEIGIKKSIGAYRSSLINQFLTESMLFSVIATLIGIGIVILALPGFNLLTDKSLVIQDLFNPDIILALIATTILIGLVAGSYPAFYLTSFKPAEVLKGKIRAGFKSKGIRSTLVVFQFTISIALIVATLLIYKQLQMIQEHNLGFEEENVIIIENGRQLGESGDGFKNALRQYDDIVNVSSSNMLPPAIGNNSVFRPLGDDQKDQLLFFYFADHEHLATLGYAMKEGRYFSEDFPSDSTAIILNEAAMKVIGWDSYENQEVLSYFRSEQGDPYKVVGVLNDFNFESLRSRIRPLAILLGGGDLISVRVAPGNIQDRIELISSLWEKYAPDVPFEYNFLDDNVSMLYESEQRMSKLFIIFTSLAIFIACLGLLGLATFTAEQKSKEIGIRKVLGASATQLVVLMSKDFTRLILISFVLSIPLAYYFVAKWLEDFAYKISIGVMTFVLGGIAALVIAWLTVSYQSFKAANTNPVNSLKSE